MNQAKLPLRILLVSVLALVVGSGIKAQRPSVVTPGAQPRTTPSTAPQFTPTPRPAPSPWVSGGLATANAMQQSVRQLDRRKLPDEVEPLVERMMRQHAGDWRVLFQGARIYAEIERGGYWVKGGYKRGDLYGNIPKGARRVYSHRRDHTRALQLLDRAIRSVGLGDSPQAMADFYWEAAQILVGSKAYYGLYELTDLSRLPSLEFHEPRVPVRQVVPLEDSGDLQFFRKPASWDLARNDGERLLWLLDRARRLSPDDYEAEAEYIVTKYLLKSYLGVQAISESPEYNPMTKAYEGDEHGRVLVENLHTLGRDETVVRVTGGHLKRVTLPEEFNFITRLSRMTTESRYRSHAALALEELAEAFENRRQYNKAATYWQEIIARFGDSEAPSWENDRLAQIIKSWGQFEDLRPVQADEQAILGLWYRNGKHAALTAHRIDVDALVKDILNYLNSDPFPVNPDRISVSKLGLHLVSEGREKYLKKQEAAWEVALEPKLNHWDNRTEIPVPFRQPGAYLVEATIDDRHACSTIVWINDMTILRRPLENGLFYYVADKGNGTPVSWAKFSFIGFRLETVSKDEPIPMGDDGEEVPLALRRQYHVQTKEITKWADAKGQLILEDEVLDPEYRWFLLTTAPGNRAAILGFSDLRPTGTTPPAELVGMRHFIVTDRPTYLPGQVCHFRGWLREKTLTGDKAFAIPEAQQVTVTLLGPNDEVMDEQLVMSMPDGSFTGSLELGSDWLAARCRLLSKCASAQGMAPVEVISSKLEPTQMALKSTLEGSGSERRLETLVTATTTAGDWLVGGTVRYQVHRRPHHPDPEPQQYDWLYGADYAFTNAQYDWFPGWKYWGWPRNAVDSTESVLVDAGKLVLSAEGTGVIVSKIEVPEPSEDEPVAYDYVVSVELSMNDELPTEGSTSTTVASRPFLVFATMDRPYYKVGEDGEFHVKARDYQGNPVKGSGTLRIYHITYDSEGQPQETDKFTKPIATDEQGEVRKTLRALETGQYRVTYILTNDKGQTIEGSTVSLVVNETYEGQDATFNGFEILSDKTEYAPGEMAHLRINTDRPEQSVALFVRPRNGVFGKAEVLRLESKSTPYEILIQDDDAPSFFVEAIILNKGEFEVHTRELLVAPPKELLTVAISAPQEAVRPGQQGILSLQLQDAEGQPTAGQVALSIQPQALLKGHSDQVDIRKVFWDNRRAYEASVEHALQTSFQSFSRPPTAFMRPIGIFGSMRLHRDEALIATPEDLAMETEIAESEEPIELAQSDPRAAWQGVWLPSVDVGTDGQASVPVTWPLQAGEWSIRAWAMTSGSKVGQGSAEVTLEEKWSVDWQTPTDLTEGDSASVVVHMRNGGDSEREVNLTLSLPSGLVLDTGSNATQTITLGPKSRTVGWRLRADQPLANAQITLRIGEGDSGETLSNPIQVTPREQLSERWWNARLSSSTPDRTLEFTLPEHCNEARTSLQVRSATSMMSSLLVALNQTAADGDSAETTVYGLFPALRLHRYLMGMDEETKQALMGTPSAWLLDAALMKQKVEHAMATLATLQNDDGGWAWSSGDSQALTTATIVSGLQSMKRSKADVPESMLGKGVSWLQSYQKAQKTRLTAKKGDRKQEADTLDAFVYLTLIEGEHEDTAMRGLLKRHWQKLTIHGQVMFANALHLMGKNEDRNTIRFELGEKLDKDENSGAIHLMPENQDFWWTWYGSSVELQAGYLKFLIRVKGDSPVTGAVAQYLLSRRKAGHFWNSARDTAFALEALTAYAEMKKQKPTVSAGTGLALMAGEQILAESAADGTGGHWLELPGTVLQKLSLPAAEDSTGNPPLRVVWKGEGTADVQAHLMISATPDLITQSGTDLGVQRSYHLVDGETIQAEALVPGAVVPKGQLVEVVLTVTADKRMDRVRLRDTLPLGCELEGDLPEGLQQQLGSRRLAMDLLTFPESPASFRYRLRTTAEGEYRAAPASLQADDHSRSKAQSDEMILVVRGANST